MQVEYSSGKTWKDWPLAGLEVVIPYEMAELGYKSPRSVQDILQQLQEKGVIRKLDKGNYQLVMDPDLGPVHAQTTNIPLVGGVSRVGLEGADGEFIGSVSDTDLGLRCLKLDERRTPDGSIISSQVTSTSLSIIREGLDCLRLRLNGISRNCFF